MKFKRYDKAFNYSYSFGQFPTIELIKSGKAKINALILHEKLVIDEDIKNIITLAKDKNAEIITNSKLIESISGKDNCYLVGVFEKYAEQIDNNKNQVVLVNPSDAGNLGTIIRTMLGFGYENLAIIDEVHNSVDIFNPKVIRASMGAVFKIKFEYFKSFEEYEIKNKSIKFAFCLHTNNGLQNLKIENINHSLVFGNEATGLSDKIINQCTGIKILQSKSIDSFNLSIAVGVSLYEFSKNIYKI